MPLPRRGGLLAMVVRPGPEFKRVEGALAVQDATIPRRVHRAMRSHAERLAEKARQKVIRLPIRGTSGKHTGMRARVAAGVRVVEAGNAVRVITTMPEQDEAIIPRGLDRKIGWRHPVFGNRNVWVRQRPYRAGWFVDTFAEGGDDIADGIEDVLEDAADNIAARGNQRGIPMI